MAQSKCVRTVAVLSGLVLACFLACGCLVVHGGSSSTSGDAVITRRIDTLKAGVTTRDDLVRAFGQPTQALAMSDGREILVYNVTRRTESSTGVIFLFYWKDEDRRVVRYKFELKDNVLTRFWKEDAE